MKPNPRPKNVSMKDRAISHVTTKGGVLSLSISVTFTIGLVEPVAQGLRIEVVVRMSNKVKPNKEKENIGEKLKKMHVLVKAIAVWRMPGNAR